MNAYDILTKAVRSLDYNGTLDDLNDEELNMIAHFVSFELQDRDMTANKSVMGNSPTQLELKL